MIAILVIAAVAVVALLAAGVLGLQRRRRPKPAYAGRGRILVPFSGPLDPAVLDAAIRVARAEEAVLVAAYLLVVPLQYPEDSARREQVAGALPVLEAVELSALRAGVPVDARIEKGRSLTHALRKLWDVESFDRIVAPASGFSAKDLAWILTNAPTETIVLRHAPVAEAA
jgi:nucleotide-binding universal stress UspA family protein